MQTPTTCAKCDAPAVKVNLCLDHLREAVQEWKATSGRCNHDGCLEPSRARGMCKAHYQAWYRTNKQTPACAADDCTNAATAKGFCDTHRMRVLRTGKTELAARTTPATCTADECDRKTVAKGLCRKHYDQQRSGRTKAA